MWIVQGLVGPLVRLGIILVIRGSIRRDASG